MKPTAIQHSPIDPPRRVALLVGLGLLSLLLVFFGGWLTWLGLGAWYQQLRFPAFQPPAWLFTPVWSIVLTLLAVATWDVFRYEGLRPGVSLAAGLYGGQFVLNAGWSLLFFTLQRPDVALTLLIVLDAVLLCMMIAYGRVSRRAGVLLIPYLIWLLFATAINLAILRLNPSLSPIG